MNTYTVALCYFAGASSSLLNHVRKYVSSFGYRAEYQVESLAHVDGLARKVLKLGRGYDLVVVVTDSATPHTEFSFLGHCNHVVEDPWAMSVLTTSSCVWKGYQPTIAIESERYVGHFALEGLPLNLLELLSDHRRSLFDRGLSREEWESIKGYVTPDEWKKILALRSVT